MTRRRLILLALGVAIIGLLVWTGPTLWTAAMTEVRYVRTAEDRIHVIQKHRYQFTDTAVVSIEFTPEGYKETWSTVSFDETPFFWRGIRAYEPNVAPWEARGLTLDEWWDALPDDRKSRQ